jgi:transcriptional regulator with XRE-family HTH domain
MDFAKRLLELRTAKGFSQGDIEERTGLRRCYLSRVENGHTVPSLETFERLAKALGIETYQLFFEGDKEPEVVPVESIAGPRSREGRLIETFRKLNPADQELIVAMLRKLAKTS